MLRADADTKAQQILQALFIKMFGDPATNPMGWETFKLGSSDFIEIKGGGTPSKKNHSFWNGTIPWVSPKDMKDEIVEDTIDHVTEAAIKETSTNKISENSILLVVRSGILAHTVPISVAGRDMALNQDMKSFTIRDGSKLDEFFLFGWMKAVSNSMIRSCIKFGATVHSIDMNRLSNIITIRPPIEEQKKFSEHFKLILALQKERLASNKKIDLLFNLLLYEAFAGNLTASWREAHTNELLQEMKIQAKALVTQEKPDDQIYSPW